MELKSIRNTENMTLGEAEDLKNKGAYLEMDSLGWIRVYKGENGFEGDGGPSGQRGSEKKDSAF